MSSKNIKTKNNKRDTINKDEKISSIIEVKEKDNKIVYVLIIIIAILISLLIYYMFFNKCEESCVNCKVSPIEIEVEPKYQLFNYSGFKFKMPLDWDFVNENINISNKEETIFISFGVEDVEYETFISDEYQIRFLEQLQTSDNIKIDSTKNYDNYYVFEGNLNNYNYLIVALGNDKKTILVKTQFIDKVTFDKMRDSIIEFATSSIEISE